MLSQAYVDMNAFAYCHHTNSIRMQVWLILYSKAPTYDVMTYNVPH